MPDLHPADVFDLEATALPVAFDIVWCRYPYRDEGKGPGPVARPCLVRRAFTHQTIIQGVAYQVGYVSVVYGTKQVDKFVPPRGFHVEEGEEKKACGLAVDTVFDLQGQMTLPWSPVYFSNIDGKPIIGGCFTDQMKARLRQQVLLLGR